MFRAQTEKELIDPKNIYETMDELLDQDDQKTEFQAMSPGPKYSQLREIDRIIYKRRQMRRRDKAIVMTIVLCAIVFMTSISAWGWSKLSGSLQTEPDQSYELSNYIGRDLSEVLEILEKDSIHFDVVYAENPTVFAGLITAQTPGAGEIIKKPNGTLTLTVSNGPAELQVMPDLIGQSSASAKTELIQNLGYEVTILDENSEVDEGTVIRTIPAAGQIASKDDNIVLVVSNGMPLEPTPSPTPTPVKKKAKAKTTTTTAAPTPVPETEATTTAAPTPVPETEATTTAAPTPVPETEATTTAAPTPIPETKATTTAAPTPIPETKATTTAAPTPVPETKATTAAPTPVPETEATTTAAPTPVPET